MNYNKTIELLELAKQNPDLQIKFMVNYEVVAGDDHTYWLADLERVSIEEIYSGGYNGHGNDERVYIRSEDEEELVEYIAEREIDDSISIDEAYDIAETIFKDLEWEKVILVYVGI